MNHRQRKDTHTHPHAHTSKKVGNDTDALGLRPQVHLCLCGVIFVTGQRVRLTNTQRKHTDAIR